MLLIAEDLLEIDFMDTNLIDRGTVIGTEENFVVVHSESGQDYKCLTTEGIVIRIGDHGLITEEEVLPGIYRFIMHIGT